MRGASAKIVGIPALTIINGKARRGFRMLKQTRQQGNGPVHFAHEFVAELMADCKSTQGTDRVGEERVRSVEGIDVTLIRPDVGPTVGLDGAGGL
jgi:hypothetical protein